MVLLGADALLGRRKAQTTEVPFVSEGNGKVIHKLFTALRSTSFCKNGVLFDGSGEKTYPGFAGTASTLILGNWADR